MTNFYKIGVTSFQSQKKQKNILHIMFAFFMFFFVIVVQAQTTIINPATVGGFNTGSTFTSNGWTVVNNGTGLVKWHVGTAVNSAAITGNSAYVSIDEGVSNSYVGSSLGRTIFFYRDVVLPAGQTNIALSFDYKSAVNSWQVFVAPTSVTPLGKDEVTDVTSGSFPLTYPLTGATPVVLGLTNTTTSKASGFIPGSFAGQTVRLIFMWTNGTGGTNPPLAIDNISLVSRAGGQTVSSIATGNYTNPTTWDTGYVPSPTDDVVINAGHTVTLDSRMLKCENLNIVGANAIMQFDANSDLFSVNNDLLINGSGARFNVYSGTTGRSIEVGHDITLGAGGRLDVSVGTSSLGALILNGATLQTISSDGTGLIGGTTVSTSTTNTSNIFNQLIVNNTSTAIPNIAWQLNNVRIKSAFRINSGKIALGTNKIIIGNFANMTSTNFTCSNGSGFIGGTIAKWYGTSAVGTAINPGVDYNPNSAALFPSLSTTGEKRWAFVVTPIASTAGELEVNYTNANTTTTGLSIVDGTGTITNRYDGSWAITKNGSGGTLFNITTGTVTVGLYANDAFITNDGNSRIMKAAAAATGAHVNGTSTPFVVRSGIALADLITSPYYIGTNSAAILGGATKTSATTGDWNTATTWTPIGVPTCSDVVAVAAGHTVTNSATASSSSVLIKAGGTFVNSSGVMTVGCTNNNSFLINNGTLIVSGGELKVNGSVTHNTGSAFNQSGGDIIVDSNNNGNVATSVGQGGTSFKIETSNLNLSAGKITIVDPLINNTVGTTALTGSSFNLNTLGAAGTFAKATNELASSGTTTIVMNGLNSNQNIYGIGQAISGTGIAPGTKITAITAGTINNQPITLTISQPTIANILSATSLNFSSMNNGSNVINFANTGLWTNLAIGQGITGTGIQAGTTITDIGSDLSGIGGIRLSLPLAGLATSPITSPTAITFDAITNNSTNVILAAANPAIIVGQAISGNGIQNGTLVSAISDAKLTLSLPLSIVSSTPITLSFYDINSSSYAFSYNSPINYATGINHTLQFGDGISTEKAAVTTNGFMSNFIVSTGLFSTGNLKIDVLDGANRFFNTIDAIHVQNNFEITTGSVFKKTVGSTPMYFSKNLINNGTMYTHSTTPVKFMNFLNGVESASIVAQTISGTGIFYNNIDPNIAYASFTSVALNNSHPSGLTLNHANFRIGVGFTMTDGILFTSNTNPLYSGRADLSQHGTFSGNFGATCHIDGPVVRGNRLDFDSSTFLNTPLGKGGQYLPIALAVTGGGMFRVEAFNTNAGSTSTNAGNLSTKRWKATREGTLGALTNYKVRLGSSQITNDNIILQATSDQGIYTPTSSSTSFTSDTPNTIHIDSNLVGTTYSGYFAYGTVPNCTSVSPGNTIIDYSITQVVFTQNSSSTGIVSGSANITLSANANSLIVPGLYVSGEGIPSGTTLVSVSGTAIVLSQAATISSTSTTLLTFTSITPQTSVCGFQSVTLKLQNEAVGTGVTYQWQSSMNNVTYTNIQGATSKTLTTIPLGQTYYKCIVTCPFGPVTATSTPVMVQFSSELTSVTGGTSCAPSTPVALSAVAASGTINWYDAQTGGTPLATGATYSPSPVTTTTYYVASEVIGTPYNAGRSFTNTLTQTSNFSGLVFNTTKNLIINTVKVHPKQTAAAIDAGAPITIKLYDSNGNIVPGTLPVTFTPATNTGTVSTTISNVVTLNYNVPVGSGYKLLVTSGLSTTNSLGRITTGNTPVGVGSFNILGSISTIDGSITTSNINFFDINVTDVCSTPRLPVIANVSSTPTIPTVTTTAASCSAAGSTTIINYNASLTYVFSPTGPSVGSGGAITGATAGTPYTVTAGNGTCTSVASASFTNAAQLTTPAVPTLTTVAASCTAAGSATVSNYDSSLTYTFSPTGPSIGTNGAITGATPATAYTVTAGNTTCTSAVSASFTNAAQLTTPAVPTLTTVAASCTAAGSATVSNYDATLTYTFSPTGPSVGTGGVINGATAGTAYTVTAGNGSCTSVASASFTRAAQLATPATPTGATTQNITAGIASEATIEDLVVTGSNGFWYSSEANALARTNALAIGTQLVSGTTYYTVNVSSNGCVSTAFAVTVSVTLGTAQFELKNIKFYPNPVVSSFTIEAEDIITNVEVYNSIGQIIYSEVPNKLNTTMNFESLPSAIYFVKVISNSKNKVISVIKK